MLITDAYRELNRELHERDWDYGTSAVRFAPLLELVMQELKATEVLDYGCGKQTLAMGLPEYRVIPYDPAIPGLDKTPEPSDVVYCGDVLEHIEPELLDNVLADLKRVIRKCAMFTISSRPATRTLADGRNAHLIQKPFLWWAQKLNDLFLIAAYRYHEGEHIFIVRPPFK